MGTYMASADIKVEVVRRVTAAVSHARAQGARTIDLTSNPTREAAHRLYEKAGFKIRDTRVYRYPL
jgi:ribosomal protein S18 acetylase RimI-like enzyme